MCCSAIPCDLPCLCCGKQKCKLRKLLTFTQRNKHCYSVLCAMTHSVLLFGPSFSLLCCISPSYALSVTFFQNGLFHSSLVILLVYHSFHSSSSFPLTFLFIYLSPSEYPLFSFSSLTFILHKRHSLLFYFSSLTHPSPQTVNTGWISVAHETNWRHSVSTTKLLLFMTAFPINL